MLYLFDILALVPALVNALAATDSIQDVVCFLAHEYEQC